jgi:ABC-type lipoprotein release transport system permease subunit
MKKKDVSFSIGLFLATKDLRHSNPWTTLLIIFVMTLTFLNMILIGGILLGLAEGMTDSFKQYYSSDLFITPSSENIIIEGTNDIVTVIETIPTLEAYSKRTTSPVKVEFGYKNKIRDTDIVEGTQAVLVGINPVDEDVVSNLSKKIIEGEYLVGTDTDAVMVGKNLFEKYSNRPDSSTEQKLKSAKIGSLIKINVGKAEKEVVIKGIIGTGNNAIDSRVFLLDSSARILMDRTNLETNEIAIKLQTKNSAEEVKLYIEKNIQNNEDVLIQTAAQAVPGSSADITKTFSLLGNLVGVIALIVGAITIFIVIFVNAITRRKYIGILKGIGISAQAIEISYVLQSLFYAVSGIFFASLFLMGFLKPFLDIHPLILPVAEGRLSVTTGGLFIKGIILIITSLISGFVPARLVTKQNTLDSILGK